MIRKNIYSLCQGYVRGGQLRILTQKKTKNEEWTQRTDKNYTQKIR